VRTRVEFSRQKIRSRPQLAILPVQNMAPLPAQAQNLPQGRLLCLVPRLGLEPVPVRHRKDRLETLNIPDLGIPVWLKFCILGV
jgi:hypothetical protein